MLYTRSYVLHLTSCVRDFFLIFPLLLFISRVCSIQKQPPEVFYKTAFLKIWQNSQENSCARVSFFKKASSSLQDHKKETLAQVFSCEIFKNTFFTEYIWMTTSEFWRIVDWIDFNFLLITILNSFMKESRTHYNMALKFSTVQLE